MTDYAFPTRVTSCEKCAEHYFNEPFLREAFASVGIEHGKSSWQMAESYFDTFHKEHSRRRTRNQPDNGRK